MNDQLMTTVIIPVLVSVLSAVVSVIAFAVDFREHKKAKKIKENSDRILSKMASQEGLSKEITIEVNSHEMVFGYSPKPLKATISLSGKKRNRTKCSIPSYQQISTREQPICRMVDTLNAENQKKYFVIINGDEHAMLMRYRVSDRDRFFSEELRRIAKKATIEQQPLIEKMVEVEAANSNKMEHITQ